MDFKPHAEDDVTIADELLGEVSPPGGERRLVADDVAIVAHEVVRIDESITALAGHVGSDLGMSL